MHNKKMENAKDFKGSLKRLILELKPFKVLIFISLILAIFGSTLTISAPNRLSKLTDEIQKGCRRSDRKGRTESFRYP